MKPSQQNFGNVENFLILYIIKLKSFEIIIWRRSFFLSSSLDSHLTRRWRAWLVLVATLFPAEQAYQPECAGVTAWMARMLSDTRRPPDLSPPTSSRAPCAH